MLYMTETRQLSINREVIELYNVLSKITPDGMTFSGMIAETIKEYIGTHSNKEVRKLIPSFHDDIFLWEKHLDSLDEKGMDKFRKRYVQLGNITKKVMHRHVERTF